MKITTHNPAHGQNENAFYILNKGYNSGKPLKFPCTNCFTLQASSPDEKQLYYWLCYGLWQAKAFRPYLVGSVIPFLRIDDLHQVLNHAGIKAETDPAAVQVLVNTLEMIESREKVMKNTLTLLSEARRSIAYNYSTRK